MMFRSSHGIAAVAIIAICTSLGYQNCARVGFNQAPETLEQAVQASETPLVCDDGQESGSIKWDLVPNQNIEEPGQCMFGGDLTLLYEKYQQSMCAGGKYVGQSEFKKGNLIGQRGGCNCDGGVSNGMDIWKTLSGQTIAEQQACPASGTLTLIYEKEQKYNCNNGLLSSADKFQKGKFLRQEGACLCADGAAEGSSSYKLVPNATITEPGVCQYGGNLMSVYEKLQKYTCTSSQSVAQNDFKKGKLLNTTGACNCEGGILNGAFKTVLLTGQTISEPATCKYGGDLKNLYEKQEKLLCNKGAFDSTGEYLKGAFIKQTGACNGPPVLDETFSIAVSKTEKPLDMIWVVDNSSSMSTEAANVRANLSSFLNDFNAASDFKFLLLSLKGNSGYKVALPTGLDATRFIQINQEVTSTNGADLLLDNLTGLKDAGKPFFRLNSKKIIVFVTDDNARINANTFLSGLAGLGVPTKDVTVFGFVGLGSVSKCQKVTGSVYIDLAEQTNGKVFNICEADWTQRFVNLRTDILTNLGRSFSLTRSPVAKITKVEVDGKLIDPSKYTFSNRVVTLKPDVVVTETSKVKIYYTQE